MSLNLNFKPEEAGINDFISKIKAFGNIYYQNLRFKESENKDYTVTGTSDNIIINNKNNEWILVQCKNELEKEKEYIWKIKILKSQCNRIMIGVSAILSQNEMKNINNFFSFDKNEIIKRIILNQNYLNKYFNLWKYKKYPKVEIKNDKTIVTKKRLNIQCISETKKPKKHEEPKEEKPEEEKPEELKKPKESINFWYYCCFNSTFYSGSLYNFIKRNIFYFKEKENEFIINICIKKGFLKFIIDNEETITFNNIPMNIPLTPTILLYNSDDSVEIIEQ